MIHALLQPVKLAINLQRMDYACLVILDVVIAQVELANLVLHNFIFKVPTVILAQAIAFLVHLRTLAMKLQMTLVLFLLILHLEYHFLNAIKDVTAAQQMIGFNVSIL